MTDKLSDFCEVVSEPPCEGVAEYVNPKKLKNPGIDTGEFISSIYLHDYDPSPEKLNRFKSCLPGDILVINSMKVGAVAISTKPAAVGPHTTVLRAIEGVDEFTLACMIVLHRSRLQRLSQGLTIKSIKDSDIMSLKFDRYDFMDIQRKIPAMKELVKKSEAISAQIKCMKTWKRGLLQKMFI